MTEPIQANSDAPAYSSATVDITADPDAVWQIMADVEDWPSWNPDVETASIDGPLAPGATITWKAGPGTIRSVVHDVKPRSRLSWVGKMWSIRATHVWTLEPLENGTRVRTDESWEGLLPRLVKRYSQRTVDAALASGLAYLKREAERREGERRSTQNQ